MREIKFRGYRKDIGWKIGYLTCIENRELSGWKQKPAIRPFNELFITYGVDFESVGQYTGLKDKQGKEIYEGDILQEELYGGLKSKPVEVCWGEAGFHIKLASPLRSIPLDEFRANQNEVAGNIYEQPELLEVK